jgi:hypothetical protein
MLVNYNVVVKKCDTIWSNVYVILL